MSITFRDLENFVTVARSKTLSAASESLGMTQPSLSLAIRKLEKELNCPLFVRSRAGIRLTPQGTLILPEAENALQTLFRIKGSPTNLSFTVGCHPSVGMFILGRFLKAMHKSAPRIGINIVNGSSAEIARKVSLGEVDFGLVMNPTSFPGLVTRVIGQDEVGVWESRHRYADQLIYNPELIQSASILSRWKKAPLKRVAVANLELILNLVESGAGYGIIPMQVVQAHQGNVQRVAGTPSFTDRLAVVCFPEIIKSSEGKIVFGELKRSFVGHTSVKV